MRSKHVRMLARTVMVHNNDIEKSYNLLNRILSNEGIVNEAQRLKYFEKPCVQRNRLCFERCRRIYDSEMKRKVNLLSRKNRVDPHPR
ncbi:28S ribosomal protein S21 [Mactra antiquata]